MLRDANSHASGLNVTLTRTRSMNVFSSVALERVGLDNDFMGITCMMWDSIVCRGLGI